MAVSLSEQVHPLQGAPGELTSAAGVLQACTPAPPAS